MEAELTEAAQIAVDNSRDEAEAASQIEGLESLLVQTQAALEDAALESAGDDVGQLQVQPLTPKP